MDIKELDSLFARYEFGETELFEILEKEYAKLVEDNPGNLRYVQQYGYLYECLGRRNLMQAEEIYEKALFNRKCKDPSSSNWRIDDQLLNLRNTLGKNKYSIELYKKRILEFPDDPDEYVYLASAYLNVDQVQEAKKVMDAAQKITSDGSASFYYVLGDIHVRLGDNEKALDYWNKSVKDQFTLSGWFSRAFMFRDLGRLEEAAAEWKKIINILEKYHDPLHLEFPKEELVKIEAEINKKV